MGLSSGNGDGVAVSVDHLSFGYGDTPVLRGVSAELRQGRRLALLGSSGCGKTTLLRLLAGLLSPTAGSVAISGKVMADARTGRFVPPERRGLGMVFQDYALWPHMTVAANVAFPLEMARVPGGAVAARVQAALERVGLASYAQRSPGELSGGQQQRVAIARAIVGEPRLVLFDEPLSNLDRDLRETLAGDLAELLSGLSLSAVYVTHDQSEAFTIAHEVAVMQGGEIVQMADPQTLVEQPANAAVAEFLKLGTVVDAERDEAGWLMAGTGIRLAGAAHGPAAARRARAVLGRKALSVTDDHAAAPLRGRVVRSRFHGDRYALSVALGDGREQPVVEVSSERRRQAGEGIGLGIEPAALCWFPA